MIPILFSAFLLALLWAAVLYLKLPLAFAVVVSLALVACWAGYFLFLLLRRQRARRAASEIEEALVADSEADGARPDQRAEIEAMQAEFEKAVQALKGSKLGRGGRDALALLPWYLIIGPPGGGKSTALRASGLKFPYLSKRGGVRGVGGTRNCEWWLTNEAVLLDSAGRYATEEEDHEEWLSFLDMLARTRPRKPLNGLIVAIPQVDVSAETEEGAEELGRKMRERVDEVMGRLKIVLPVYVMFTKCDLLPGFVETFGDLPKAARGQVFGFTLPLAGTDKAELFGERFDELVAVAEERSIARLGEERQLARRERIFEFPQQLAAGKAMMAGFIDALFAENVYQDAPILRGVYFTSGTQEGRVVDRVMTAMAEAFGVRPALPESEPVLEAKSYFLREVFAKVIIPDQGIAVRNRKAVERERLQSYAVAGGAIVLALVIFFFVLRAFLYNRELIHTTGDEVAAVASKLEAAGEGPPPLAELEPLRERLALLVRYADDGPPFGLGLGLYRGDDLLPHVRHLYAATARRLLLDPVFRQDVAEMDAFVRRLESSDAVPSAGEYAREYDALKLHLFLTSPRRPNEPRLGNAEVAFIGERVADRWSARSSATADPSAVTLIGKNAELFAKLLAQDPSLALPRYEDLVLRERRVLSRLPLSELAVEKLTALMDGKGYDLTLAAMLGGPVSSLGASASVRGAFTRRGYEEMAKKMLDDPSSLVELWVVGDESAGEAREQERLRSRYFQRYIGEWQRFLDSISVRRGQLPALSLLQDLTRGEPPPYGRLFRAVGYNTRLAGTVGAIAKAGEGLIQKVRTALDPQGQVGAVATRAVEREEETTGPLDVERAFAGFAEFGYAPDALPLPPAAGGGATPRSLPLDVYQEQLSFVRDALQASSEGGDPGALIGRVAAARTRIQSLIDGQEVGWRPRLASLLWPPLEAATSRSIAEASKDASSKWCSEVVLPYRRTIAGRYPFQKDGEDAAVADVADFFRPASGKVWGFYNESLKNAVQRSGDGFQFTRQLGGTGFRGDLLAFLRRSDEISTVLFPPGAADPSVVFSVNVRPTPGIATVILDVSGQRVEYRNGPEEWHRLVWPGQGNPGASLRVRSADGHEETLQRDGDWGLFRLLEAGSLVGDARANAFTVAFHMPGLNATVHVDFQTARSETPFFGVHRSSRARFLDPFRVGDLVPTSIGREGGGCP
jgi:type VI secretion system protein ImpL